MYVKSILIFSLFSISSLCFGHAGGLDENGGHINRNTGDYHCHREGCIDIDTGESASASTPENTSPVSSPHSETQEALDQLATIPIRPEGIPDGFPDYDRNLFPHWSDLDGDCEDSRTEVLLDTSLIPVDYDAGNRCKVDSGYWFDPYTNQVFLDDDALDIDHIVPLKEAYLSGAFSWTREERKTFANDRENLIAVSLSANRQKGDKDPAEWMPPHTGFACPYLQAWVTLKTKYDLAMNQEEHAFIENALRACLP